MPGALGMQQLPVLGMTSHEGGPTCAVRNRSKPHTRLFPHTHPVRWTLVHSLCVRHPRCWLMGGNIPCTGSKKAQKEVKPDPPPPRALASLPTKTAGIVSGSFRGFVSGFCFWCVCFTEQDIESKASHKLALPLSHVPNPFEYISFIH